MDDELYTWLKGQLTTAKQNSPLWVELAEAIEEIFDIYVGDTLERLEGLSSLLAMNPDDLNIVLDELGDFFLISEKVAGADRGIAAAQRFDEIHLKNTVNPIENILKLEFEGLTVEWEPIYIHKDEFAANYGDPDYFLTEDDVEAIGGVLSDYVITSRAIIGAQASELIGSGYTLDDLNNVVEFQIRPILPTQIVLDDTQLIYRFDLQDTERFYPQTLDIEILDLEEIDDNESLSFSVSEPEIEIGEMIDATPSDLTVVMRFDDYHVDALILDTGY